MQPSTSKLHQIFNAEKVLDFQSVQKKLKNRSRRSIFRDLEIVGYFSSFTHAGKYYTLKNIPRFDSDDIWFYQHIGFSKFGTLKDTIVHLIDKSENGEKHNELMEKFRIRVHNTLLDLIKSNRIIRKKIKGDFFYFSNNSTISKKQILHREKELTKKNSINCTDWIIIEVLAAIIRIKSIFIDSQKIVSELNSRNISITIEQVEQILNQFKLKKTLDSSS